MFRIRKGTNRWDERFIKTMESKNVDLAKQTVDSRDRSLVGGYRTTDPMQDRKWQDSGFKFSTGSRRMKTRNMKNKVIRNRDIEVSLDKEQERLFDHNVGGVGGFNQDQKVLSKDKQVASIVDRDDKVEAKPRNEWNTNEDAGAFTGGLSRAEFLKKNKLLEI